MNVFVDNMNIDFLLQHDAHVSLRHWFVVEREHPTWSRLSILSTNNDDENDLPSMNALLTTAFKVWSSRPVCYNISHHCVRHSTFFFHRCLEVE
jgi:hypothetical protein